MKSPPQRQLARLVGVGPPRTSPRTARVGLAQAAVAAALGIDSFDVLELRLEEIDRAGLDARAGAAEPIRSV
jgi:hypothetical protein